MDFDKRIHKAQQEESGLVTLDERLATTRIILLLLFIFFVWRALTTEEILYVLGFNICIIAFIGVVIIHNRIKNDIKILQLYITINNEYAQRLSDEWQNFSDTGQDLADNNHPYAFDLDVLGENSLYQKISVATTFLGRKKLGLYLLNREHSKQVIENRQNIIRELLQKIDFVQQLQVILRTYKATKDDPSSLLNIATHQINILSSINILSILLPVVIIASLLIGYITNTQILITIALSCFLITMLSRLLLDTYIASHLKILRTVNYQIQPFVKAFVLIDSQEFEDIHLNNQIEAIIGNSQGILLALSKLEKIATFAHITHQPLFALPLNGLLMWDFWVVKSCKNWQEKFGFNIEEALNLLAEIEALSSLATLGYIENVNFALVDNTKLIEAKELGHPLINPESRINNTFKMEDEIFIITGSNMSGKTTFMRTIGINMVLAFAGAPICGKSFRCCPLDIYTSMRIGDNLGANTSTFHAEIKRIKLVIEAIKENNKIFFLIDEIFRGTNSQDRINGAKSIIKALKQAQAMGAITTHDLEMCILGNEQGIINYHFTDFFDNHQMYFDYKLKNGISTKTNAKYLLEMIGLELQ